MFTKGCRIIRILTKPQLFKKVEFRTFVTTKACSNAKACSTFKFSDLQVRECRPNQKSPLPEIDNLGFGQHFSDHMLEIEWNESTGWASPHIVPLHNLSLHPAAKVLHYAQEIFEGMKAYRSEDDKIRLFRPDQNMKRMNLGAERACLPTFDGNELTECIKKLVSIDKSWVPKHKSSTLYLRPTMIGTQPTLGVSSSTSALLFVITSPVGPYFKSGIKPVSLLADPRFVRAWTGGSGDRKMGANYAPTLSVQREAEKLNLQQVLWLSGPDQKITEVGAMNIFILLKNEKNEVELVTPKLDGIILPGVTRMSILELAREWKEFKVSERDITMKELIKALAENRVVEVFGSGTACVICPVGNIYYEGKNLKIPTTSTSPLLHTRILTTLNDIQYGKIPHKWSVEV